MAFTYSRVIRFHETDAAGVVYFANLITLCHEAYESALSGSGIEPGQFFAQGEIGVPIVHASTDFLRPLRCGDIARVHGMAVRTGDTGFEICYEVFREDAGQRILSARAMTRHVCISTIERRRVPLTADLVRWLEEEGQSPKADS